MIGPFGGNHCCSCCNSSMRGASEDKREGRGGGVASDKDSNKSKIWNDRSGEEEEGRAEEGEGRVEEDGGEEEGRGEGGDDSRNKSWSCSGPSMSKVVLPCDEYSERIVAPR